MRVVSLVPSLTEAVAVTLPGLLVGATDWCSHRSAHSGPGAHRTGRPAQGAGAGTEPGWLGVHHVHSAHPQRYPRFSLAELRATGPDLVVLPDEPYRFTRDDGPDAFAPLPCALVSGRHLTWYGPSLAEAPALLADQLADPVVGSG